MSFYASFQRIASEWVAARRMAETERLIGGLSSDLRKDIGWPPEIGRAYRSVVTAAGSRLHG